MVLKLCGTEAAREEPYILIAIDPPAVKCLAYSNLLSNIDKRLE